MNGNVGLELKFIQWRLSRHRQEITVRLTKF